MTVWLTMRCATDLTAYKSGITPSVTSVRPAVQFDVVSTPAGFTLTGFPISKQPLYFRRPSRYGFVCISANTQNMADAIANYTGDAAAARKFSGPCFDGLNEAGLSAAYLWDEDNKGYANISQPTDIDPAKETISYLDYTTRVLAECDTIECARALTGRLNIVSSNLISAILEKLIHSNNMPLHTTFCDRSGRCIAVEWTKAGKPEIFDLKLGVLTNEPQIPTQERMYEQYTKASLEKYGNNSPLNWPGGTGDFDFNAEGELNVEPSARFIRMAMLMKLYGPVPYPNPTSYSSPSHYGSKISAFAQINSIIVSFFSLYIHVSPLDLSFDSNLIIACNIHTSVSFPYDLINIYM